MTDKAIATEAQFAELADIIESLETRGGISEAASHQMLILMLARDQARKERFDAQGEKFNAEGARDAVRAAVCRYVNAQGPHMSEAWKKHFVETCDLEVIQMPYFPVRIRATVCGKDEQ